jgi:hypothetical protein
MSPTKSKLKSGAARFVDPVVALREAGKFVEDAARQHRRQVQGPAHQARGPPGEADLPQWLALAKTAKYLDVSTMSVTRYANDPAYVHLNFPKASVVVDRCYWNRSDLDAWMRSRVGATSSRKAKADADA